MDDWLTTRQIIEAVAAGGKRVTEPQLERWRTLELLPKATPGSRGRGRGIGRLYPRDSVDRVLGILYFLGRRHSLIDAGLCIWANGLDYRPELLHQWLVEAVERMPGTPSKIQRKGVQNLTERFVDHLVRDPKLREQFGVENSPADLERIRQTMEALFVSILDPSQSFSDETIDLLLRAFSITDTVIAQLAVDGFDLRDVLRNTKRPLTNIQMTVSNAPFGTLLVARRLFSIIRALALALKLKPPEPKPWFVDIILRVQQFVPTQSSHFLLIAIGAVDLMSTGGTAEGMLRLETQLDRFTLPPLPPPWQMPGGLE